MPGNWIICIWKLNICNYVTFCHHVVSHLYCFGCVHQLAGIAENNCCCKADNRYVCCDKYYCLDLCWWKVICK